jgi:hypothetical protein
MRRFRTVSGGSTALHAAGVVSFAALLVLMLLVSGTMAADPEQKPKTEKERQVEALVNQARQHLEKPAVQSRP